VKQVRITERQNVQLRMDATNIWNHPTFFVPDVSTNTNNNININNTTFGKITSTFFGRRLIQLSLYYNF